MRSDWSPPPAAPNGKSVASSLADGLVLGLLGSVLGLVGGLVLAAPDRRPTLPATPTVTPGRCRSRSPPSWEPSSSEPLAAPCRPLARGPSRPHPCPSRAPVPDHPATASGATPPLAAPLAMGSGAVILGYGASANAEAPILDRDAVDRRRCSDAPSAARRPGRRLASRAPLALRFAARDASRQASRTGPAVVASMLALAAAIGAATITSTAAARTRQVPNYAGSTRHTGSRSAPNCADDDATQRRAALYKTSPDWNASLSTASTRVGTARSGPRRPRPARTRQPRAR